MPEKSNVEVEADALNADMKQLRISPSSVDSCIYRRPYHPAEEFITIPYSGLHCHLYGRKFPGGAVAV
jgi:hypothetical protein